MLKIISNLLSTSKGQQAEKHALAYLEKYGLKLITQNFHSRRGEIDLIMEDENTLVFVEVRYRKSAKYGSAIESVNAQKQKRIIHTAQYYIQQNTGSYSAYRFDVIGINPNNINWIKDAFQLN